MTGRVLREASRVELALLLREPVALVFALALPVVNVVVLGAVFGDQPDPTEDVFRGVSGSTYYTPAYMSLVAAAVGLIVTPTQLAGYRERGVLRRIRASGLPVSAVLVSQVVVGLVLAVVGAALVLAVSFASNEPDVPADVFGVLVAFLLGTVALTLLGLVLGALLPTARAAQGAGVMLWFVVLILGGAGPPPDVLPDAMGVVGTFTPLRPLVIALQDPWFGNGWNVVQLLVLLGLGVASGAVAAVRLRR
ncbi:MAG: ABC transporter permease [Actinomycetales bacterium]|nr:ABC transporter permease [Actinomycetales bacterium]